MDTVELKTKIQEEMKSAMLSHNKERLSVIRLILSAIKQQEVDQRIQLNNEHIIDILVKMIKQRKESIAQFQVAKREDLVNKENFEITVINEFLPEQLSANDISQLIEQALTVNKAASIKDMSKVMQYLRERLLGKADLEQVGKLVKDRLLKA